MKKTKTNLLQANFNFGPEDNLNRPSVIKPNHLQGHATNLPGQKGFFFHEGLEFQD